MKKTVRTTDKRLIVIGGGPAGMMAAITAAEKGADTLLLERNGFCGKKLNITGKGRCNLTNNCTPEQVIANTPKNGRFLFSALKAFSPADLMLWFESRGLPLKTERGNRVFPKSDKAVDVSGLLRSEMKRIGVKVLQARISSLDVEDGHIAGVHSDKESFRAGAVVLATGGLSYPGTGSTGDGYTLAESVGHTITDRAASIVPLVSPDSFCAELSGFSLKNTGVKVYDGEKLVYEDFGELLFTHFGISGPVVLSASAHLKNFKDHSYRFLLDLKPALTFEVLDARILRDFGENLNKSLANGLSSLLPRPLIPVILAQSGLEKDKQINSVTRSERISLAETIKAFRVNISAARPVAEAVITSGGVNVREIDPRKMASKLVDGLFFAGELIDVDAYTGGFNLQIAWSTGHSAGLGSAEYLRELDS